MSFILILFFGSLFGIIFMIGKKLILLKNRRASVMEEIILEIPFIADFRDEAMENIKKYGHKSLVGILRLHIKSSNFLKTKYEKLKVKIKSIHSKKINSDSPNKQEISKFLKIISDYKHKIKEIKHKIHEEEKNS